MNSEWTDSNAAIQHYYDSDFPSQHHCRYPENFDATTAYQGLRFDVQRYLELAGVVGGPILELCCGTGRVALPLAAAGFDVIGVDISRELLRQFQAKLERESEDLQAHIEIVEQDVTQLDLPSSDFPLAILAFNSLLCITDFDAQCQALERIAAHLGTDGLLLLDVVNPLELALHGDPVPKPFFTRRNPHTGRTYTRFASVSGFDDAHRQTLHGWYDEIAEDGLVTRRNYSVTWRPVFRYELQLMIERAGMKIACLEGGHRGEPYTARSPHMFVHARKPGALGEL